MSLVKIERCPTGIPGFDELCEGGFVRNSVNTLIGGPGTGKSTFLMQFLWNGVNMFDENGLYISFEPDIESIFGDALSYGWDFSNFDAKGKCKFIKFSPKTSVSEVKQQLMKIVSKNDVKRVCFDPISIFCMYFSNEVLIRENVFELVSLLKRLKVTVVISDEVVELANENILGDGYAKTSSLGFLSDGLINLYSSGLGGETDRAIRIAKMRRTNHTRGPVPFSINSKGIVIKKK